MSLSSWAQTSASMFPSSSKRLVRSKSGLKIVSQHARGVPPWNLEEPHWIKDEEVSQCIECKTKFDFLKRRHHCRRCGKIFCGKCCHDKVQFHRMSFVDPVRMCGTCGGVTKREKEFFEKQLKGLIQGAPFHVRASTSISRDAFLYNCKLSVDERFLLFDNHGDQGEEINPVDLDRILDLSVGDDGATMIMQVRETATDEIEFTFECPAEPSRKPSQNWIEAFNKGIRMVFESRTICRDNEEEEAAETVEPK